MNEEEKMNAPVETTTPEIQNPILPPEPEEPIEEPVMIAENIDEMSQEEIAAITTSSPVTEDTQPTESSNDIPVDNPTSMEVIAPETTPVDTPVEPSDNPVIPADAPDLGGPITDREEENVPSFQQFPSTEEKQTEEATPVVEQNAAPIDPPTNLMDMFQTGSSSEPTSPPESSFQQMPEVPSETTSTMESSEDTIVTDDYDEEVMAEEATKKKKKIFPLILIGILLAIVIGIGIMAMKPKETEEQIEMLRPERAANSNMNIAVLGDTNVKPSTIVSAITKKYGTEVKEEDIDHCKELEENQIKFKVNTYEIKTDNNQTYNINYPCEFESAIRYLSASEGDQTVDGAILIVNTKEGITDTIKDYISALKGFNMKRMVFYLTNDGDTEKLQTEIVELLDQKGLDGKNTPIVTGDLTDEKTMESLITKVGNWITKDNSYKKPTVVTEYKNIDLYTTFLTKEEGGLQGELKDKDKLVFTIHGKDYTGTVTLEEGHDSIKPGDVQALKIELSERVPMVTKMRVQVKQGNTLVGIGVISELR